MVRAPCCEKMGLKKGPWSPDEDKILISYIEKYGHGNWRALPKLAGLLRCGKSCRLRWINYLKPDIKRGNFSKEEEETIINLHQMLGNRWSAIAARLPGRTDNEIKNVWHTHLKKRLKSNESSQESKTHSVITILKGDNNDNIDTTSEMSSVTDSSLEKVEVKREELDYSSQYFPTIDESFWSEDLPKEMNEDITDAKSLTLMESVDSSKVDDISMDFWYDLFIRAGDIPDLPEF